MRVSHTSFSYVCRGLKSSYKVLCCTWRGALSDCGYFVAKFNSVVELFNMEILTLSHEMKYVLMALLFECIQLTEQVSVDSQICPLKNILPRICEN